MRSKQWKKWSEEEDELLKQVWSTAGSKEDLMRLFPERNYNSLMLRAGKLGVQSGSVRKRKNGSLNLLTLKTINSFYLWGFIMADGHIEDRGSIYLNQHINEKAYITNLYALLGGKEKDIKIRSSVSQFNGRDALMCQCRIGHKAVVDRLRPVIGLSSNKTYIPPIIEYFFEPEIFFAFFIGMLDGDGSIWMSNKGKSTPTFQMILHFNWLNTLTKMQTKLKEYYQINTNVKVTKNGYALIECADQPSMRKMYDLSSCITIKMKRKWDKLVEFYS